MTLSHVATPRQPKDNVETTLKCLLGVSNNKFSECTSTFFRFLFSSYIFLDVLSLALVSFKQQLWMEVDSKNECLLFKNVGCFMSKYIFTSICTSYRGRILFCICDQMEDLLINKDGPLDFLGKILR